MLELDVPPFDEPDVLLDAPPADESEPFVLELDVDPSSPPEVPPFPSPSPPVSSGLAVVAPLDGAFEFVDFFVALAEPPLDDFEVSVAVLVAFDSEEPADPPDLTGPSEQAAKIAATDARAKAAQTRMMSS